MSDHHAVPLRIGTRGSMLARTQTGHVLAALRSLNPDREFADIVVRTSGDEGRREVLGAFVKELQEALLRGAVDAAVHSLKDLPTQPAPGLRVAAYPSRQDSRETLIVRSGTASDLAGLEGGARIGSGSLRRTAQMRAVRPDLEYLPLVGNVDTRLRKLRTGEYDAIVLAAAGLIRLGLVGCLEGPVEFADGLTCVPIAPDVVLPAPGQGALAVECRVDDQTTAGALAPLNDPSTELAVRAERALLDALGGGCRAPIAAGAALDGGRLRLRGLVASPDGLLVVAVTTGGPSDDPERLGRTAAAELRARGAEPILAQCRG